MKSQLREIIDALKELSVIQDKMQEGVIEEVLLSEIEKQTDRDPSIALLHLNELLKTIWVLDQKNRNLIQENKRMKEKIEVIVESRRKKAFRDDVLVAGRDDVG